MKRRNFLKMIGGVSIFGISIPGVSAHNVVEEKPKTITSNLVKYVDNERYSVLYDRFTFPSAFNQQVVDVLAELREIYPNREIRLNKNKRTVYTYIKFMKTLGHEGIETMHVLIDDTTTPIVWVYNIVDPSLV